MTCILREFPALSKWVVYWLCTSPRRCNPSTLIFISLDFSLYCERVPFLQGLKIINQGQELAMGNFWLKPQKAEVPSNNFLMEQGKKAGKHQIHTIRYHRMVVSRGVTCSHLICVWQTASVFRLRTDTNFNDHPLGAT